MACFNRLHVALGKLEAVYWSFFNLLQRFDCRLASESKWGLSATRPFSPNTTCHNCAVFEFF